MRFLPTWDATLLVHELHPFEKLDGATQRELRAQADRLAEFHA